MNEARRQETNELIASNPFLAQELRSGAECVCWQENVLHFFRTVQGVKKYREKYDSRRCGMHQKPRNCEAREGYGYDLMYR